MEYKGAQNNLLYIILKLHDLGVSDQQLTSVYHSIIHSMDTLLLPKIYKLYAPLHINNCMYSSYLEFFGRQVINHGIQDTLNQFFYCTSLSQSIGSQCLPMVHLALGLKHDYPEIITQALSYAATSYQDTSFLLDERGVLYNNGYFTAYEILINQVKVDPRFGSFSSKLTYRKILKSARELLHTYVYLWELPNNIEDALNELRVLAACLLLSPTDNDRQQNHTGLDITGNLLKSINAMDILYPNNTCPTLLVRL
ncbi:hypothetical protein INT48_008912 [Thamnidium elegans]|uniref:Uncharacterized protein n=1 Tax=Thamnidium elegans TaxID=101142 RepID=A0A8H7SPB8_9FUNG|nr:hypothetical protein INT48_008912 [Thamnidium elegans]